MALVTFTARVRCLWDTLTCSRRKSHLMNTSIPITNYAELPGDDRVICVEQNTSYNLSARAYHFVSVIDDERVHFPFYGRWIYEPQTNKTLLRL